jgi:hypothetical protein
MPRAVERISGAGCGSGYDLLPGLENVVDGFNGTRRDAWYVIDHYVPKAQKALFYRHNSQNMPSWVPPWVSKPPEISRTAVTNRNRGSEFDRTCRGQVSIDRDPEIASAKSRPALTRARGVSRGAEK